MLPSPRMSSPLHQALKRVVEGKESLTRAEASTLFHSILNEQPPELQVAALLGALAARGETPAEIAGFVDVLRAHATSLPLTDTERACLVDTCGTGGDHSGTFNISTAAALVAAAAEATAGAASLLVAKHGNRAVTSQSGSADVLEALGIPVDLAPAQAAGALRRHRFAFLHAPTHHPLMRAVLPIRRALGVRTVFNLLGPLANPAGAPAQVVGVSSAHLVPVVAEALALLDTRHALVVHGTDPASATGIDEISLSGPTYTAQVRAGQITLRTVHPADFGLVPAPLSALAGGDAPTNAALLRRIFSGVPGPPRDVVVLNAAAVLVTAGLAENFASAARLAETTIDSGSVTRLIAALAAHSRPEAS